MLAPFIKGVFRVSPTIQATLCILTLVISDVSF